MELAAIAPVRAVGVDVDAEVLKAAESLEASAAKAGGFSPGRDIGFEVGDAYALPRPDKSLDRATARFVFQPLVDPPSAGAELARVVRRGGLAWLIDVDEGLSFSHPPASAAYRRLAGALGAQQEGRGGDRRVGRTLPALLDQCGSPSCRSSSCPKRPTGRRGRATSVGPFSSSGSGELRPELVGDGFIEAGGFDDCLERFAAEVTERVCTVENHLAVVGRRR
jgi:hypothetical protein